MRKKSKKKIMMMKLRIWQWNLQQTQNQWKEQWIKNTISMNDILLLLLPMYIGESLVLSFRTFQLILLPIIIKIITMRWTINTITCTTRLPTTHQWTLFHQKDPKKHPEIIPLLDTKFLLVVYILKWRMPIWWRISLNLVLYCTYMLLKAVEDIDKHCLR